MLLSTDQAAARLRIRRETLYAYVSRGLIASHRGSDGKSYFHPDDVERLASRARRRGPAPVRLAVESAITDIEAGRLYYRGRDAVDLCVAHPFETVAELLWTGELGSAPGWPAIADVAPSHDRLEAVVAALTAGTGIEAARTLLPAIVSRLPRRGPAPSDGSFAAGLWSRLGATEPTPELLAALDLALGLSADHGLIRSTLVARVVAASGADLGAALSAALGPARVATDASHFAAARRLFAGERVAIEPAARDRYPKGDPRTEPILDALRRAEPDRMRTLDDALQRLPVAARPPDADVALTAMEHVCGMEVGAAETIAIVARMAGWIAHALEEYAEPTGFRVHSIYTGPPPQPARRTARQLDAVLDYLKDLDTLGADA